METKYVMQTMTQNKSMQTKINLQFDQVTVESGQVYNFKPSDFFFPLFQSYIPPRSKQNQQYLTQLYSSFYNNTKKIIKKVLTTGIYFYQGYNNYNIKKISNEIRVFMQPHIQHVNGVLQFNDNDTNIIFTTDEIEDMFVVCIEVQEKFQFNEYKSNGEYRNIYSENIESYDQYSYGRYIKDQLQKNLMYTDYTYRVFPILTVNGISDLRNQLSLKTEHQLQIIMKNIYYQQVQRSIQVSENRNFRYFMQSNFIYDNILIDITSNERKKFFISGYYQNVQQNNELQDGLTYLIPIFMGSVQQKKLQLINKQTFNQQQFNIQVKNINQELVV